MALPFTSSSWMTLRPGDVVLIRMEFHQTAAARVRPAAVLLDTGDEDFVAAPIISHERNSRWDLPIEKWRAAGLWNCCELGSNWGSLQAPGT
jgi:hypothetical protein